MEFEAYLDALASADPTPGGGSAATLVGALAAALCAMVARVTMSTPKRAPLHEEAAAVAEDADDLRRRFMELRPVDEAAVQLRARNVEEMLLQLGPEVSTQEVGVAVLEQLRMLDDVAYLRFASVYKGFEAADDFAREAGLLTKETAPKLHEHA